MSSLDASRPWILYWTIHANDLLGFNINSDIISTLDLFKITTGGYGGGIGQAAHLATSYSAINTIAILHNPTAYNSINRESMYSFLLSCKTSLNSFRMGINMEDDIRGCYCALSIAYLLNIATTQLTSGVAEYIKSCQSYQGGISNIPNAECHGGYTFCALAALDLLDSVHILDLNLLLYWLLDRQTKYGGFNGRTNKLVDGCYSFWVGACFPILEQVMDIPKLYDLDLLKRFVLESCQDVKGGFKDKPGKPVDYYHTCYCLSGLSAVLFDYKKGIDGYQVVGDYGVDIKPIDPVFNIGIDHVKGIMQYFKNLDGLQ